jgi:uncharacterized protein DUF3592
MDTDLLGFCALIGLMFAGVIGLAVGVKFVEVYRARKWLLTTGIIKRSEVRSHKGAPNSEGQQFTSEPLVMYEYTVGDEKVRGTRVNFAEKISGPDIAPTLARYPVGKTVSVYYNPKNPQQAVLERDMPVLVWAGAGCLMVFFLGGALAFPFALSGAAGLIAPALGDPSRSFPVAMLAGMGLFTLLLWYALQRQLWDMRRWSSAPGKVLVSEVESYMDDSSDNDNSTHTRMFRPSVVYTFKVDGRQYMSDRVVLGTQASGKMLGGAPGFVNERVAKYPHGSDVTVYYDPKDPTQSVLERKSSATRWLPVVALGLWALAGVIGGIIGR